MKHFPFRFSEQKREELKIASAKPGQSLQKLIEEGLGRFWGGARNVLPANRTLHPLSVNRVLGMLKRIQPSLSEAQRGLVEVEQAITGSEGLGKPRSKGIPKRLEDARARARDDVDRLRKPETGTARCLKRRERALADSLWEE